MMQQVEYCRWRYRDPLTGTIGRTDRQMTAEEAARRYAEAVPIEGTKTVREVLVPAHDDDWPEPFPVHFRWR